MQRTVALALALLIAPLAGCLGDGGLDEEAPVTSNTLETEPPAVGLGLEVARSALLTEDGYGFEPSVEVSPDGTIYVTAAQGLVLPMPRSSRLWVSHDGGASFEEIPFADPSTGVSNLPAGAEGDLAVDEAGNAYFVDLSDLVGTTVSRSSDGGETWELRNPNAFAVPGGDREWVASGPEGLVAVTWNQLATGLWVAVSTDGGLTFPTQTYVPGYSETFAGNIDVGPEGNIYVARTTDERTVLLTSTDQGATFTEHTVHEMTDGTSYIFPVPTTDEAGNVYVAWAEKVDGNVDVFYAWSADAGETFSDPIQATYHQGASVLPWIDAAEPGHVSIAYYGAPGHVGDPNDVSADWYPYVTDVRNATGSEPTMDVARLAQDPVKTASVVCTSGLGCDGGRELADYLQVSIGPEGSPHVVWGDQDRQVYWATLVQTDTPSAASLAEALAIPQGLDQPTPTELFSFEQTLTGAQPGPAADQGQGEPTRVETFEVPNGTTELRIDAEAPGTGTARIEILDPEGTRIFSTADEVWLGGLVGYTGLGGQAYEGEIQPGVHEVRFYVTGQAEPAVTVQGLVGSPSHAEET